MSTPFKMKGITPLKHIGKHPAKDGHTWADHAKSLVSLAVLKTDVTKKKKKKKK